MTSAIVVVELAVERQIISRPAVLSAACVVVTLLVARYGESVVTGHEQIELSVAIVVEKRGTRAEGIVLEPGFLRRLAECAVPVIAIENVRTVIRHEKIGIAVIVIIAHCDSHAVGATSLDTGLLRNVGKTELPGRDHLVSKQAVSRPMALRDRKYAVLQGLGLVEKSSLEKIDIQITVSVVIQKRDAGSHNLGGEVRARGASEVLKAEPDLCRQFAKEGAILCLRFACPDCRKPDGSDQD